MAIVNFFFVFVRSFYINEIQITSYYEINDLVFEKFRCLTYEEKILKTNDFWNLTTEIYMVANNWFGLYDNLFKTIIPFLFVCLFLSKELRTLNKTQTITTLFFLLNFSILSSIISNVIAKNSEFIYEKLHKKQWMIKTKEINNSNLIEAMGICEEMREKQISFSEKSKKYISRFSFNCWRVLEYNFDGLFCNVLPALLAILEEENFRRQALQAVSKLIHFVEGLVNVFRENKKYKISLNRLNTFFSLPERNDQLSFLKIDNNSRILSIELKNIDFSYNEKAIFTDYSYRFTSEKINYLTGRNGTGKSTLINIMLGLLPIKKGEIIINLENGSSLSLSEINLKHWREKNVCFLSHMNLFEEGSVGERQWKNFNKFWEEKKDALLWIMDEADNALDREKRKKITEKNNELLNDKRMIIYVSHNAPLETFN